MSDGEEWKGESEEEAQGHSGLFSTWFGKPLTPEQLAAGERKRQERVMKGEINYLSMLRFDPNRTCTKCGAGEAKVRHCLASINYGCETNAGKHEHFHRTCRRCKYVWYEKVLNEEPHE